MRTRTVLMRSEYVPMSLSGLEGEMSGHFLKSLEEDSVFSQPSKINLSSKHLFVLGPI